jgi:hypothetical protein
MERDAARARPRGRDAAPSDRLGSRDSEAKLSREGPPKSVVAIGVYRADAFARDADEEIGLSAISAQLDSNKGKQRICRNAGLRSWCRISRRCLLKRRTKYKERVSNDSRIRPLIPAFSP